MRNMPGYPVTLTEGPISLRPPHPRDARQWQELQYRNRAWLTPWEAGRKVRPGSRILTATSRGSSAGGAP